MVKTGELGVEIQASSYGQIGHGNERSSKEIMQWCHMVTNGSYIRGKHSMLNHHVAHLKPMLHGVSAVLELKNLH